MRAVSAANGLPPASLAFPLAFAQFSPMRKISEVEFHKHMERTLDRVTDHREPVIITRASGKPAAVLIPLEEFTAWKETLHLLRSPANAARLRESIAEFDPQ